MADLQIDLANARWRFETMRNPNGKITTLWVSCMHWPGCCEEEDEHGEFNLGVCREGTQFRVGNEWFWNAHNIDYQPVMDAVARVMTTGDLADVAPTNPDAPHEDALH